MWRYYIISFIFSIFKKMAKLFKFAEVFGCTPSELMGSTENKEDVLADIASKLNEDALKRLVDYAKDLYSVERNRKE